MRSGDAPRQGRRSGGRRGSGADTVAFAWIALLAFVRLATEPGLLPRPLTADEALDRVDDWLGAGPAVVLEPTAEHARVVRRLLDAVG